MVAENETPKDEAIRASDAPVAAEETAAAATRTGGAGTGGFDQAGAHGSTAVLERAEKSSAPDDGRTGGSPSDSSPSDSSGGAADGAALERPKKKVKWYRSPVPREELSKLNKRSDVKGFVQAGGFTALLLGMSTASVASVAWLPWYVAVIFFYMTGMCYHFTINGVHELVHDSVFKTKRLNAIFGDVLAFLGWHNHYLFWASHTEHHKFTLHPPDDLEVVLPTKHHLKDFLKTQILNVRAPRDWITRHWNIARGVFASGWERTLMEEAKPEDRRRVMRWSRIMLVGHGSILAASLALGAAGHWAFFFIPLAVSLAPAWGGWLFMLMNATQHAGLKDNTPDFRLCCRTIHINPLFRFLYWHMNYHTEHHMYAAVPCYNLRRLHHLIADDLPECPRGLIQTWRRIAWIQNQQEKDPEFQYEPELPATANPARR